MSLSIGEQKHYRYVTATKKTKDVIIKNTLQILMLKLLSGLKTILAI